MSLLEIKEISTYKTSDDTIQRPRTHHQPSYSSRPRNCDIIDIGKHSKRPTYIRGLLFFFGGGVRSSE